MASSDGSDGVSAIDDHPPLESPPGGLFQRRSALLIGLLLGLVGVAVVAALSLAIGTKSIPLRTAWSALTDFDPTDPLQTIVRTVRVPRTVIGLLVGVSLGLVGAVLQGITRNPLADPSILGLSSGAVLAAVMAATFLGIGTLTGFVWFAFGGVAIAGVLVYGIGSLGRDGATPVKLTLTGAALTALFVSVSTAILLADPVTVLATFRFWLVGSLDGRDAGVLAAVWPFIVVGSVMALLSGRALNLMSLGDDVAKSLGQRVELVRALAFGAVVILTGAATAVAGPIVFVGLVIPHVARAITGPDYRWILAYSAVLAPILLLGADIIGRVIAQPRELEVGIVTAFIGAPFFIMLVRRRKLAEL